MARKGGNPNIVEAGKGTRFVAGDGRANNAGKLSQKKQAEDKIFKDILREELSVEIKNGRTGEVATRKQVSAIQLANMMSNGDLRAIQLGLKILGELAENIELSGNVEVETKVLDYTKLLPNEPNE